MGDRKPRQAYYPRCGEGMLYGVASKPYFSLSVGQGLLWLALRNLCNPRVWANPDALIQCRCLTESVFLKDGTFGAPGRNRTCSLYWLKANCLPSRRRRRVEAHGGFEPPTSRVETGGSSPLS